MLNLCVVLRCVVFCGQLCGVLCRVFFVEWLFCVVVMLCCVCVDLFGCGLVCLWLSLSCVALWWLRCVALCLLALCWVGLLRCVVSCGVVLRC